MEGWMHHTGLDQDTLLDLLSMGYRFEYDRTHGIAVSKPGEGWSWMHDYENAEGLGLWEDVQRAQEHRRGGGDAFWQGGSDEFNLDDYLRQLAESTDPALAQLDQSFDEMHLDMQRMAARNQAAAMRSVLESNARSRGAVGSGVAAAAEAGADMQARADAEQSAAQHQHNIQRLNVQMQNVRQQQAALQQYYSHELGNAERQDIFEKQRALMEYEALLAAQMQAEQSKAAEILGYIGQASGIAGGVVNAVGGIVDWFS
jgi:DNA-binding protein Fis